MYIREYQIGNRLYEDVIGSTYLANTTDLERAVYFKVLHADYTRRPDLVQAFHSAADKLCQFNHHEPIQALEHGEDGDTHYIIFEYFALSPLEQILQTKTLLHIVDAVNLIEKIANMLRDHHLRGRVHGALTPQCIFVDEELLTIALTDFGFDPFIRLLMEKNEPKLESTLPYYSPELMSGQPIDRRSDIYSLGVLFYRIITGALPWPELSYRDYLSPAPKIAAIPPSLQRLEIPELVDGLILEMLERDSNKRCRNLDQFMDVFQRVKTAILASITPITPSAPPVHKAVQPHAPDDSIDFSPAAEEPALDFNTPSSVPSEKANGLERAIADDLELAAVETQPDFVKPYHDAPVAANHSRPQAAVESPQIFSPSTSEVTAVPAANQQVKTNEPAGTGPQPAATTSKKVEAVNHQPPPVKKVNDTVTAPKRNHQPKSQPGLQNSKPKSPAPGKPAPSPAAHDDDFREVTATQTEEFATTRTININLPWGNNASALWKFFVAPLTVIILLYIAISFFDFKWARSLPNFKNSLLYVKIQELVKGDNQQANLQKETTNGHLQNKSASEQQPPTSTTRPGQSSTKQTDASADDRALQEEINRLLNDSTAGKARTQPAQEQAPSNLVTMRLFVHSARQPIAADVYLNGKRLGRTNRQGQITISNLITDYSYSLKVVGSGYPEWNKDISFQNSGLANFEVDLNLAGSPLLNQVARETRRASVTVLLANALVLNNAFVFVNGKLWDGPENMAPTRLSLPAGRHQIEIRKEGFRSEPPNYIIDLAAGENKTISFLLIPN